MLDNIPKAMLPCEVISRPERAMACFGSSEMALFRYKRGDEDIVPEVITSDVIIRKR